jgi:hypothetical protein
MERAARAEKNHKKTKKGIGAGFAGWVGMVTDWRRVKEIGAWMRDGAGIALDPRRYPWSERERWMNPPETKVSFEQAMAREEATEADVARKHLMLASSSLIASVGAFWSVWQILVSLYERDVPGLMAATGMGAFLASAFLAYSFRAWKLRRRDMNAGFLEFLAKPISWFPPIFYVREDGKENGK